MHKSLPSVPDSQALCSFPCKPGAMQVQTPAKVVKRNVAPRIFFCGLWMVLGWRPRAKGQCQGKRAAQARSSIPSANQILAPKHLMNVKSLIEILNTHGTVGIMQYWCGTASWKFIYGFYWVLGRARCWI